MSEGVPFSAVKVGERITFDNGYHMSGKITRNGGTHNGVRAVFFHKEGDDRARRVMYAAHRSVIRG